MLRIKNTTLVYVDGRPSNRGERVMRHCLRRAQFSRALMLSSEKNWTRDGIENIQIEPFNDRYEYDYFLEFELGSFIHTERFLYVQNDSWIVNPNAWLPEFYEYDYVAPSWLLTAIHVPPFPDVTPETRVGCGGFVLKTKRMLDAEKAIRDEDHILDIYPPHPNDCFVCRGMAPYLRKRGITFAPVEIADRFGIENQPYVDEFGFHGPFTLRMNPQLEAGLDPL